MSKTLYGLILGLGLLAFGMPATSTQSTAVETDGCAVLSDIVYRQVVGHGLGGAGGGMSVGGGYHGLLVCDRTTSAVTTGFAKGMQQINIYLSWQSPAQERGDSCAGVDLAQCYPDQSPYVPYNYGDAVFIRNVWFSVRNAVEANATEDDVTRFVQAILSRQLQREMHRNVRQSPQEHYFRQ